MHTSYVTTLCILSVSSELISSRLPLIWPSCRSGKRCYAAHCKPGVLLQWIFLCFGLKAVPLLWAARMLQDLRSQLYLDDPLRIRFGMAVSRQCALSLLLLTHRAVGLRVAWHKGTTGFESQWIGVHFMLLWDDRQLPLEVPQKMIQEVDKKVSFMVDSSVVGIRRLRSLAGRLSWMAGVVPRMRLVLCIHFATVAAADHEWNGGIEEERRIRRKDKRSKKGMVLTRKCIAALLCIASLFPQGLRRTIDLTPKEDKWMVVTDASPWGFGALL